MDRQLVQQFVIASMLTTTHVNTNLPNYIPRGFDHQPPNGGQPRDSLGGSSPKGVRLGEPPFNRMLDLLDGQHLTCACSYHHGINRLLCNLYQNQQQSCHT
jgi:hypothetical protein